MRAARCVKCANFAEDKRYLVYEGQRMPVRTCHILIKVDPWIMTACPACVHNVHCTQVCAYAWPEGKIVACLAFPLAMGVSFS